MPAQNDNQNQGTPNQIYVDEILLGAIKNKASDIHISTDMPPVTRINGILKPLAGFNSLTEDDIKVIISQLLTDDQVELLYEQKELDTAYEISSKERFRINIYFEKGNLALAFRLIPPHVPSLDELNLPHLLYDFCKLPQGLVLMTGPAGVGKSTSLAAMINWINQNKNAHIITVEDPIEYNFKSNKCLIHQRELSIDTKDWNRALKSALREDMNILLVGETRDFDTMQLTLRAAESGHLVYTTLHSYSAPQAVERIIGMFPESKHEQVRIQLSMVLEGIVTQTLVKGIDPTKQYPAVEILIGTDAVRNTIREGNIHYLENIINTNTDIGMISMEKSLAELVNHGLVSIEEASSHARRPEEFVRFLKKK